MKLTRLFSVLFISLSIFLITGCDLDSETFGLSDSDDDSTSSLLAGTAANLPSGLPQNPTLTNPRGAVQHFSFTYKEYDNSYRPRWPTYFATELGIGPGSYTTLDGERAEFRSFDFDNDALRPSYTIPAERGTRFNGPVLAILWTPDDVPIAWFVAPPVVTSAPLPQ